MNLESYSNNFAKKIERFLYVVCDNIHDHIISDEVCQCHVCVCHANYQRKGNELKPESAILNLTCDAGCQNFE